MLGTWFFRPRESMMPWITRAGQRSAYLCQTLGKPRFCTTQTFLREAKHASFSAKGGVLLNCTLWKVLCRALKLIMHRKTQGRSALVCRLLYMVWWKQVYTIAGEHDHSIFNSTGEGYHDTVSVKSRYTRPFPLLQTATVFYHSASFD